MIVIREGTIISVSSCTTFVRAQLTSFIRNANDYYSYMQSDCAIRQGDLKQYADGEVGLTDLDLQFHIVTGTPPYFPSKNGALPLDAGRGQCAFECRGGIEVYVETCSKLISDHPSAKFFVCQTYLELKRTERSAKKFNMEITKRLDVYGKTGHKNPLFCVFSMKKGKTITPSATLSSLSSATLLSSSSSSSLVASASAALSSSERINSCIIAKDDMKISAAAISVQTARVQPVIEYPVLYEVVDLYVRRECGCHTAEYDTVMREMGRPLSTCACSTASII